MRRSPSPAAREGPAAAATVSISSAAARDGSRSGCGLIPAAGWRNALRSAPCLLAAVPYLAICRHVVPGSVPNLHAKHYPTTSSAAAAHLLLRAPCPSCFSKRRPLLPAAAPRIRFQLTRRPAPCSSRPVTPLPLFLLFPCLPQHPAADPGRHRSGGQRRAGHGPPAAKPAAAAPAPDACHPPPAD